MAASPRTLFTFFLPSHLYSSLGGDEDGVKAFNSPLRLRPLRCRTERKAPDLISSSSSSSPRPLRGSWKVHRGVITSSPH